MSKKKLTIILIIVILLLLCAGGVYWFLLKDKLNGVDPTASNKPVDDDSIVTEFKVPSYTAVDLVDITDTILADAKEWSSDFRILSITGTTAYTLDGDKKLYFGTDGGKFSSWMLEVYSPSKKVSSMYLWKSGKGSFSENMEIDSKYLVDAYNQKSYYNDLKALASTDLVVSNAVKEGLNLESNYIYLYMGEMNSLEYGSAYTWKVVERSKTENDEYDTGLFVNGYSMNAKTGEFIGMSDSD